MVQSPLPHIKDFPLLVKLYAKKTLFATRYFFRKLFCFNGYSLIFNLHCSCLLSFDMRFCTCMCSTSCLIILNKTTDFFYNFGVMNEEIF